MTCDICKEYDSIVICNGRRMCHKCYTEFIDGLKAKYNSNTPLPKRYGTKCPATVSGVPCMGELCRSRRKGCLYWLFRRDPIAGRQAVKRLKIEGYEVF